MDSCSVGIALETTCHKKLYQYQKQTIISLDELNHEEKELLRIRITSECEKDTETSLTTICTFHKNKFLDNYSYIYKTCSDIFHVHKKPVRNQSLRQITYNWYLQAKRYDDNLDVIPGRKLCCNCRKRMENKFSENPDIILSSGSEIEDVQSQIEANSSLSSLNDSLHTLGESRIKLHSVALERKTGYGKRKLEKINDSVKSKLCKVLQLDDALPAEKSENEEIGNEIQFAFQSMISKIKNKIQDSSSTRAEKIQVLTMAPENWSRKKVSEVFGVSERLARDAKQQGSNSSVCSLPPPRKGKSLSEETVEKVTQFYENNQHSRIMPGIKDRVSVKKNVYQQKRLLLCTLQELYAHFKEQNPSAKIGLAKFCALRPKWCVNAGASGTHAVCVCTIHQNVVLLIHAAHLEEWYKDLLSLAVCCVDNRDCMLQRCTRCPGFGTVLQLLQSKFEDLDEIISFKQ